MPYFMDFHIFEQITVDEVKQAHIADRSVENRHGVKVHQFWVNEDLGTVICLMEGPSAEACSRVHQEAHGNVACNITEVKEGFYEKFMGERPGLDHGLVLKPDGKVDDGLRYLMVADLVHRTNASHSGEFQKLLTPSRPAVIVTNAIVEYGGSVIRNDWDDSILGVFSEPNDAVQGALEISRLLCPMEEMLRFKIGLSQGKPMSRDEGFFEESLRDAKVLNLVAEDKQIVLDFDAQRVAPDLRKAALGHGVRILSLAHRTFLKSFFDLVQRHLNDPGFSVNFITEALGISRPQLYRRIVEISGRSPNQFIRDIRLRKALSLIHENRYSVSEIAYEVGFGTPSYFAKRFQEKYGIAPSKVAG